MGVAYIQRSKAASDGESTIALAAIATTSGNCVIVTVKWEDTPSLTASVSDTAGNTYTALARVDEGSSIQTQIFYAKNITGNASNVITVDWTGSARYWRVVALEYSGLDTVSPYDNDSQTGQNNGSAAPDCPNLTATAGGVAIFWVGEYSYSGLATAGSGWTLRYDAVLEGDGGGTFLQDKIYATAGTISPTSTVENAFFWISNCSIFKEPSRSPPPFQNRNLQSLLVR